jgi:UDP-N-acetylmuramate--alanine ligase
VTYGLDASAHLRAVRMHADAAGTRFHVESEGQTMGEYRIVVPGRHNVRNALATLAVALHAGAGGEAVRQGLEQFRGVERRFQRLTDAGGVTLVDDYAHHPTEVAATLAAARQAFPGARVHAVFQPHLYSRTRDQAEGFGRALLGADRALVTPVYASREQPIEGVDAGLVVEAARAAGHRDVHPCADREQARELLAATVGEGDVVLTLGAGDVYKLAEALAAEGSDRAGAEPQAAGAGAGAGGEEPR